ncbi:MAG: protein kinase [Xenococcaceae cyanobacterium]
MSQCLNPDCLRQNPDEKRFCQKCGSKLLLRERYRAIRLIGQGGFGKTFLAIDEDKPSKPYCVIKQFFPQAQDTETVHKASKLFEKEAVRLDDLGEHPQIPELLAYFTQDERQYLVQEYIDGQNLAQELANNGVFNESEIRSLLIDLLSGLQFVHDNQVIHRDIKPENIIRRQSDGKLVLVDFGAAKYATVTALGVTGTVIGSAEYVAPEQSRGKAIFASDLYSLGVTCINLLTDLSPFDLYDISENDWVWRQYLVKNSVSNELGQILDKLIEGNIRTTSLLLSPTSWFCVNLTSLTTG